MITSIFQSVTCVMGATSGSNSIMTITQPELKQMPRELESREFMNVDSK